MRIVIDLQGAQSDANRMRGIGRYSSSLALAMAQQAGQHEVVLALNGRFPEAADEIIQTFRPWVARNNMRVWEPPRHDPAASEGELRAKEKLYEAFLASLRPDVTHVSSLFEGNGDAAVTSIGNFLRQPTSVTLYDLIPLLNAQHYLKDPGTRDWYMRKVASLRRADMWFAISESSRQEGIEHLGLEAARCINASTAAYGHFKQARPSAEREQALRRRYGLDRPFVMYTGGIDVRKNLDGLVRAFALLPGDLRARHQAAIVCSARPEDRAHLLELANSLGLAEGQLVVTGFVPEQDLVDLYNLCALFAFPSWHEGFGLPVLEAMQCGAVVIAADTSSLPEVVGSAEALFDPHDDNAMAAKMMQGLSDEDFRTRLRAHAQDHARQFSWTASARRVIEGLEALHRSRAPSPAAVSLPSKRPRLAYVSPLPPAQSGIADYSAELLPFLVQHYDIELISETDTGVDAVLTRSLPVRTVEWFKAHADRFDRVLYQFGNSVLHQHMFDLLQEIPGTVVLHDFFLSGAQAAREFQAGRPHAWTRALYESHGYAAVRHRFRATDIAEALYAYPCNFDVLRHSQGVIVHSPHSMELAQQWYGTAPLGDWALVPHLRTAAPVQPEARRAARRALGLDEDDFIACSFGLLGATKLNHRLVAAWQASQLAQRPECQLHFVGQVFEGYDAEMAEQMGRANPGGRIRITGRADPATYRNYLEAADIAIQLRTLSRGETSGAVLDAMSHGIATIANAHGSMAFLPRDAVLMLDEEASHEALVSALEDLHGNPQQRAILGDRAIQTVRALHAPAACAHGYAEAIERFAAQAATERHGLVRRIRDADLLDVPGPRDGCAAIAAAIAISLPTPSPRRQLFIDITGWGEASAGQDEAERREGMLLELLDDEPEGWRLEPVRFDGSGDWHGYRYARHHVLTLCGLSGDMLADDPIDFRPGDMWVGAAPSIPTASPARHRALARMRRAGVHIQYFIHEWPLSRQTRPVENDEDLWLQLLGMADGFICTSRDIAQRVRSEAKDERPVKIFDSQADAPSPQHEGEGFFALLLSGLCSEAPASQPKKMD